MAVFFKQIQADIYTPDGQTQRELVATRMVDIQPARSEVVFEQFGVELEAGEVLYDDKSGDGLYVQQGIVEANGIAYVIRGVKKWSTLPVASHLMVLLERKA